MLEKFRQNLKGVTASLLVGIIIVPFALFGIDSIFLQGSAVETAAEVNGEKISELRLLQGIESRKRQFQAQFKDMDLSLLDDDQLRGPVLDGLIRQAALSHQAKAGGMGVSEATFKEIVLDAPVFKREGKFDPAVYEYTLQQMGYTAKTYRERMDEELLVNQLVTGGVITGFVTPLEKEAFAQLTLQQRNFSYLTIPLVSFLDQVEVSESDIQGFYDNHPDTFVEPEKAVIEYVTLSPADLIAKVAADEDQLLEFYHQKASAAQAGTSWTIAHILVEKNEDAEATLAELQQQLDNGADFSELAKTYSQDYGSADQGGKLGSFTEESLPEEFKSALSSLTPGQVSSVVESDSGYHLVKLLEKSTEQYATFEEVKGQLAAELNLELAQQALPEQLELLKEQSYNVESLDEVAARLQLKHQVSEAFPQSGGNTEVTSNPKVVEVAFSDDVLHHGYASEVMEIGDNSYVVLKLKEFIPSQRTALKLVADQISEQLRREKAQKLVEQMSSRLLAEAKAGVTIDALARDNDFEWQAALAVTRFDPAQNPFLIESVFKHPASATLPVTGSLLTPQGDAMIYVLSAISQGRIESLSVDEQKGLALGLSQSQTAREWRAYEDALVSAADIEIAGQ